MSSSHIAVVGIACRFPGGVHSPGQLLETCLARRCAFRAIPRCRLAAEYQGQGADQTYATQIAALDGFDFHARHNKVPQKTVDATDTAHWLALTVALEAFQDAGGSSVLLSAEKTAVIVGNTLTGEMSRAVNLRQRWPFVEKVLRQAAAELASSDGAAVPPALTGLTGDTLETFVEAARMLYASPFPPTTEDTLAGALSNTIAGRISNKLGLHGGCYTVDGACASSLLAIEAAATKLTNRDVDMVLAGGVDISLDPLELVGFAKAGALSKDGTMRVYDEHSQGFIAGEGCGFVVLVRLDDALARSLPVYATIDGWGMSSDGTGAITAPNIDGQTRAFVRAYEKAGFGMDKVHFIEGHGTGTAVGDRVELQAVAAALDATAAPDSTVDNTKKLVGMTSIKSLFGHCKAAAGMAGFIKVVTCVNQRVIPPAFNITTPNKLFDTSAARLYPVLSGRVLDKDATMHAGVSGMGFGGINVHVVVSSPSPTSLTTDDAPAGTSPRHPVASPINKPTYKRLMPDLALEALLASCQSSELFTFVADSTAELIQRVKVLAEQADGISIGELVDLSAHTLCNTWQLEVQTITQRTTPNPSSKVQQQQLRAAVVASTPLGLTAALNSLQEHLQTARPAEGVSSGHIAAGKQLQMLSKEGGGVPEGKWGWMLQSRQLGGPDDSARVGFLYPGQGSQFVGMAARLIHRLPWAQQLAVSADEWLQELGCKPVSHLLTVNTDAATLSDKQALLAALQATDIAQPAIVLAELLWLQWLRRLNVLPAAVLGHSLGELSALSAAEAITPKAAIQLAGLRGLAMDSCCSGSMLALRCSRAEAVALMQQTQDDSASRCWVANCNTEVQTVVACNDAALQKLQAVAAAAGVKATKLQVAGAFHCPLVMPAAEKMASLMQQHADALGPLPQMSDVGGSGITLVSSVDGSAGGMAADVSQHLLQQMVKGVDFITASSIFSKACTVALEVGPGSILTGLMNKQAQHVTGQPNDIPKVYPVEPNPADDDVLNKALAALHVHGVTLSWSALFEGRLVRPFVPASKRIFITNPCEKPLAAVPAELKLKAAKAAASYHSTPSAVRVQHSAIADAGSADSLLRKAAKQAGLSGSAVEGHMHTRGAFVTGLLAPDMKYSSSAMAPDSTAAGLKASNLISSLEHASSNCSDSSSKGCNCSSSSSSSSADEYVNCSQTCRTDSAGSTADWVIASYNPPPPNNNNGHHQPLQGNYQLSNHTQGESPATPAVEAFLLAAAAAATGWDQAELHSSMKLLDDLGLDSIKAGELIAAAAEQWEVAGSLDASELANATVAKVAAAITEAAGCNTNSSRSVHVDSQQQHSAPNPASNAAVEAFLLAAAAAATGWDQAELHSSMRLLDDLGLDSIKAGELIAAAAEQWEVAGSLDASQLANASMQEVADAIRALTTTESACAGTTGKDHETDSLHQPSAETNSAGGRQLAASTHASSMPAKTVQPEATSSRATNKQQLSMQLHPPASTVAVRGAKPVAGSSTAQVHPGLHATPEIQVLPAAYASQPSWVRAFALESVAAPLTSHNLSSGNNVNGPKPSASALAAALGSSTVLLYSDTDSAAAEALQQQLFALAGSSSSSSMQIHLLQVHNTTQMQLVSRLPSSPAEPLQPTVFPDASAAGQALKPVSTICLMPEPIAMEAQTAVSSLSRTVHMLSSAARLTAASPGLQTLVFLQSSAGHLAAASTPPAAAAATAAAEIGWPVAPATAPAYAFAASLHHERPRLKVMVIDVGFTIGSGILTKGSSVETSDSCCSPDDNSSTAGTGVTITAAYAHCLMAELTSDSTTASAQASHSSPSSSSATASGMVAVSYNMPSSGVADCSNQMQLLLQSRRELRVRALHWTELHPRPGCGAPPVDWGHDDVVLVTGGGKGITAECALALAVKHGVRLALVGRTGHPDKATKPLAEDSAEYELQATLDRFKQHGVACRYYSCDMANPAAVQALVAAVQQQQGPITGLVHGAAVNSTRRADATSAEAALREISPKCLGLVNLLSCLPLQQLKAVAGFSSIIGTTGMPGNTWYALSNEIMDATLRSLAASQPHISVSSQAYSVWSEAGMGARMGSVDSLKRMGIWPIPLAEGTRQFMRLWDRSPSQGPTHVLVAARMGGLDTWKPLEHPSAAAEAGGRDDTAPVAAPAGTSAAANASVPAGTGSGMANGSAKVVTEKSSAKPPSLSAMHGGGVGAGYRYLEHVLHYEPGVEIVAKVVLSTDRDLYTLDHDYKGTLLLPTVFGLEAMAQAAAVCVGYQPTVALFANLDKKISISPAFQDQVLKQQLFIHAEDIQLMRPITVPRPSSNRSSSDTGSSSSGNAEVLVWAQMEDLSPREGGSTVPGVAVRTGIRTKQTGWKHDHFSARLVFTSQPPSYPTDTAAITTGAVSCTSAASVIPLDPLRDLYSTGELFQGPLFQRIQSVHSLGGDNTSSGCGTFAAFSSADSVSGRDGFRRSTGLNFVGGTRLILGDPYLRDSMLQSMQLMVPQAECLPVSIESWTFPLPTLGSSFTGNCLVNTQLLRRESAGGRKGDFILSSQCLDPLGHPMSSISHARMRILQEDPTLPTITELAQGKLTVLAGRCGSRKTAWPLATLNPTNIISTSSNNISNTATSLSGFLPLTTATASAAAAAFAVQLPAVELFFALDPCSEPHSISRTVRRQFLEGPVLQGMLQKLSSSNAEPNGNSVAASAAGGLQVVWDENNKPTAITHVMSLSAQSAGPESCSVSVAHSGPYLLFAASSQTPEAHHDSMTVGCDVELIKPISKALLQSTPGLWPLYRNLCNVLSVTETTEAIGTRAWCIHEALVKATGSPAPLAATFGEADIRACSAGTDAAQAAVLVTVRLQELSNNIGLVHGVNGTSSNGSVQAVQVLTWLLPSSPTPPPAVAAVTVQSAASASGIPGVATVRSASSLTSPAKPQLDANWTNALGKPNKNVQWPTAFDKDHITFKATFQPTFKHFTSADQTVGLPYVATLTGEIRELRSDILTADMFRQMQKLFETGHAEAVTYKLSAVLIEPEALRMGDSIEGRLFLHIRNPASMAMAVEYVVLQEADDGTVTEALADAPAQQGPTEKHEHVLARVYFETDFLQHDESSGKMVLTSFPPDMLTSMQRCPSMAAEEMDAWHDSIQAGVSLGEGASLFVAPKGRPPAMLPLLFTYNMGHTTREGEGNLVGNVYFSTYIKAHSMAAERMGQVLSGLPVSAGQLKLVRTANRFSKSAWPGDELMVQVHVREVHRGGLRLALQTLLLPGCLGTSTTSAEDNPGAPGVPPATAVANASSVSRPTLLNTAEADAVWLDSSGPGPLPGELITAVMRLIGA